MDLSPAVVAFWAERHLCTVTTLRADGTPHVVPMGVVLDPDSGTAWAITSRHSQKVRNVSAGDGAAPVAVCQVDGRRWSTLEGNAQVLTGQAEVAEAERRYAERYQVPRENPERVALRITLTRLLGNVR
jgi:F420H(2)-dependent biliverdin reductase